MKIFIAKLMIVVSFGMVVYLYASFAAESEMFAEAFALSLLPRPYVGRVLLPWLVRGVMALGFSAFTASLLWLGVSAIGLVYGIKYLYETFKRK